MNEVRRRLAGHAGVAAAGLAMIFGAAAWLHTPRGIAALRAAGVPCPVGQASATDVAAVRERGLAQLRGLPAAPSRAALGLAFDGTTLAQAQAWAARKGIACDQVSKGLQFLRCRGVDAAALGVQGPPVSELWLSFGAAGRLVGVDLYRRGLDDGGAATAWSDASARLRSALGAPLREVGDAAPAVLRASALQTARIEYRYRDYLASVTAANLPHAGLAVREQYLSASR
jgi:hypothetical protein